MQRNIIVLFLVILFVGSVNVSAQNINNPLNYSSQATLIGQNINSGDPASMVMPGTSVYSGLGSFMDNPASMALANRSFVQFGLSNRTVEEEGTFLSETMNARNSNNGLTNIGFVYRYPTVRGSLVIGAGYNQLSNFNRAFTFRGHNNRTSITDAFKAPGSPYQDIAYEAYATDVGDDVGDWDESIFRVGFDNYGDFLGITQQGDILESGRGGEYSMFIATEFRENFMFGASLGLVSGTYRYSRFFQEIDSDNLYNSTIVEGETDIDNIRLDEELTTDFTGFRARLGVLYKINENFNIGASYSLPTLLEVNEEYYIDITSEMDNGDGFGDSGDSEFTYDVRYPSELSLGIGVQDLNGFSVSFSADFTDYSNTEVDFLENDFYEDERYENDFLRNNFESVWSFRGGVGYQIQPSFILRGGYAYIPTRFVDGDDDRRIFSAGADFQISNGISLNIGAQYTTWEERSSVYDYADYDYSLLPDSAPSFQYQSENALRTIDKLNILATLRFRI